MGRYRKSETAAVRFGPALKAFLLCLFLGGSGVGYVWQKNQIYELSQQIRKREIQLQALERRNKLQRDYLDLLRSPRQLEVRMKALNLGLVAPQPDLVLRLMEPTAEPRARNYADFQRSPKTAR